MKGLQKILLILGSIVFIFICSFIFAFPVKWLWNWLIPSIFHLTEINVFQAWGLSVLCGLLFKNNISFK